MCTGGSAGAGRIIRAGGLIRGGDGGPAPPEGTGDPEGGGGGGRSAGAGRVISGDGGRTPETGGPKGAGAGRVTGGGGAELYDNQLAATKLKTEMQSKKPSSIHWCLRHHPNAVLPNIRRKR